MASEHTAQCDLQIVTIPAICSSISKMQKKSGSIASALLHYGFVCSYSMFSTSVRTMNAAPTHLVARARRASVLLALFLAMKESAALEQDDADDDETAEKLKNRNE